MDRVGIGGVGLLAMVSLACVARSASSGDAGDESTTGASTGVDDTDATATSTASSSSTAGTGASTESDGGVDAGLDSTGTQPSDDDAASDDGCGFLCAPDVPDDGTCDLWAQSCSPGEKCTPWGLEGWWTSTRCVPIAPDPAAIGEPCTIQESTLSGLDDCAGGALCWSVDVNVLEGVCMPLCQGSEAEPVCEGPAQQCLIGRDGVPAVCLERCDPIVQDCGEGSACVPIDDGFECMPDPDNEPLVGEPCDLHNQCDPGLYCAPAAEVPGCAAEQCCASLCDLGAADPDSDCQTPDGQSCLPYFGDGMAPPGLEHVGGCAIP